MVKAAEDSALQYMKFMNVIFAAQKQVISLDLNQFYLHCKSCKKFRFFFFLIQNILIDACVLDSDSGLLQQVSFPLVFLQAESLKTQHNLPVL